MNFSLLKNVGVIQKNLFKHNLWSTGSGLNLNILKMSTDVGPIEKAITETINDNLSPVHLEVINESYMHNVPKGSESHFKVLIVSDKFNDLPLLKRHRMINDLVRQKLDGNFVHALSIEAKTPQQWDPKYKVEPSPNCRGGFGK